MQEKLERNLPKICPRTWPVQCLHENSQSSKVFFFFLFFKKKPQSFKSAFKNPCDFMVELELSVLAVAVLFLRKVQCLVTPGRLLIFISISVSSFPFCYFNRSVPVGGV